MCEEVCENNLTLRGYLIILINYVVSCRLVVSAVIKLQFVVLLVVSGFAGLVSFQAALSALLGGLSYILPTVISVLVLRILQQSQWSGLGFLVSECLKIVLACILMLLSFLFYREVNFIAYFLGMLSVSHLIFLFFLRVHCYGK